MFVVRKMFAQNFLKVTVKTLLMLQNISSSNKCCSIVNTQVFQDWFHNPGTAFNNSNNDKCFLSTKSAYTNDFWRIIRHWRLAAKKFSLVIKGINWHLSDVYFIIKHIKIENKYFKTFQDVSLLVFLYFWSNKCSLGKHETCSKKKYIYFWTQTYEQYCMKLLFYL